MNKEELNKRLADDPWYDPKNTQLDLSGFPSLQIEDSEDASFSDSRFSQMNLSSGMKMPELKKFISKPLDDETVSELAKVNPDLAEEWNDRLAEKVSIEFANSNPNYFKCEENFDTLVSTLAFSANLPDDSTENDLLQAGVWTVENLHNAFEQLTIEGKLKTKLFTQRELSNPELSSLQVDVASGNWQSALMGYLSLRLGMYQHWLESIEPWQQTAEISKPENRQLLFDATYFIFESLTTDYSPDQSFVDFGVRYIGGRLPTVALWSAAWNKYQSDNKHSYLFGGNKSVSEQVDTDFEGMSDDQIDNLKRETIKEYYKQKRNQ
jgi:hypothetical protein